jgi:phage tail sheath protein FI
MPTTYNTPGVYVEEIATLPASIVQVPTAIPAFIGYTEKGEDLPPTSIRSFAEFQSHFGGAPPLTSRMPVEINLDSANRPIQPIALRPGYYLFDSVKLFYANGGGECYVVSVDAFGKNGVDSGKLGDGLAKVATEAAPTLIVIPDAAALDSGSSGMQGLQTKALSQCNDLGNRFSILDVGKNQCDATGVKAFRDGIGLSYARFGAAYTPWLKTTANLDVRYGDLKNVQFKKNGDNSNLEQLIENKTLVTLAHQALEDSKRVSAILSAQEWPVAFKKEAEKKKPDYDAAKGIVKELGAKLKDLKSDGTNKLVGTKATEAVARIFAAKMPLASDVPEAKKRGSETQEELGNLVEYFDRCFFALEELQHVVRAAEDKAETDLREGSPQYRQLIKAIGETIVEVPPSGAIAGVYASVDASRGVWKAPANVSLNGVVGLTHVIDDEEQQGLNVDSTSGQSINAIRAFPGKGILVWGARTLAGNDNEWRYVNVRRLFIMAEESIRRSTAFVVFEPNDENTWIKVKAMIENYLSGLWRQGALAGAKPEQAFFVNVGLGSTMTPQDILEGYMRINVGMAAVRPSEFVIIQFSHKLQEA